MSNLLDKSPILEAWVRAGKPEMGAGVLDAPGALSAIRMAHEQENLTHVIYPK